MMNIAWMPPDARLARIVEDRIRHATIVQLATRWSARARSSSSSPNRIDSVGHAAAQAGCSAGLLPVVAERALERAPVVRPAIDDAERAADDAVAAAVADVGLDVDRAELGADDRRRSGTPRGSRHSRSACRRRRRSPTRADRRRVAADAGLGVHLDELHVPPRRVRQGASCCRRSVRSSRSRRRAPGSIPCTRPRRPCSRCRAWSR